MDPSRGVQRRPRPSGPGRASAAADASGARARAVFAALCVLAVTVGAAYWVRGTERALAVRQFRSESESFVRALRARVESHDRLLRAAESVARARPRPDAAVWRAFVDALDLATTAQEIQAIGLAVVPEDRTGSRGRRDGAARVVLEAGPRARADAIGTDWSDESVRREAVERARETGGTAASARLEGVDAAVRGPGASFILVRGADRSGFAYAVIDVDALAGALVADFGASMRVRVFDGTGLGSSSRLYDSAGEGATQDNEPLATRERTVDLGGHSWTLQFATTPPFEEATGSAALPVRIGVAGGLLAALVLALFWRRAGTKAPAPPDAVAVADRDERAGSDVESAVAPRPADTDARVFGRVLEGMIDRLQQQAARAAVGADAAAREDPERLIAGIRGALKALRSLLDRERAAPAGPARTVDLTGFAAALRDLAPFAASPRAAVKFSLDDALACCPADADRLREALVHLLIEASESIGERAGMILVRTGAADCDAATAAELWPRGRGRPGPYAFVEISDTGRGLEPEDLRCLFAAADRGAAPVVGAGLARAFAIARDVGGVVRVTTRVDRGTTVRILLPTGSGGGALADGAPFAKAA